MATEVVVRRQLRIQGSLTYDHPRDFAAVLERDPCGPAGCCGPVTPLAEAERAFRAARAVPGKTWIRV